MKQMWQEIGTRLLYSTAYHPATDGQTERAMQIIESALRHYIQGLTDKTTWPSVIASLYFHYNNTRTATTQRSSNELDKGFCPVSVADVIANRTPLIENNLPVSRLEAHDAMAIAAMTIKKQYDSKHTPKFFKVGDLVRIRLHTPWSLRSSLSWRFSFAQNSTTAM
jgi:hypothetical protein